jgi:hypothetical protein
MKIKISENESYEIKFDNDEITAEEFLGFMNRLRVIEKILMKGELNDYPKTSHHKIKDKGRVRRERIDYPWKNNRAELIKALKVNYFKDIEARKKYEEQTGQTWDDINKNLHYNKIKFKIKPHELGLKYFPSGRGKKININQALIKKEKDRGDDYD